MKNIFENGAGRTQRRGSDVARVRRSLLAISVSAVLLPSWASAATAPPLGSAAAFGVLAASAVSSTGASNVTGDVGVSPGSAIDGFPPGTASGSFYSGVASPAGTAQADALTAYNNAAGQVCDTDMTGVDLGGKTLLPGVYCFNTSAGVTGILTLDLNNDPNGVFIFQIGSTLTTSANSAVQVINGTAACSNIIWKVGSSATLGLASQFKGNILALASVTLTTGANNNGGLYGLTGGVTLDTSAVQACGLPPPVCVTDIECIDDGNICTDEECDPLSPEADSFGCIHPNNTAPCDDNQFCNGEDICANGLCGHSGDPCLGGGACGDSCNELADDCFVLAGTECRPANGVCDSAESCTGLSADCPIDGFLSSLTQCRGSNGVCDPSENCTGLSGDCPINAFLSSATECRAANGVCDAAENCTGSSADCPIDAFLSSAMECRAANGVCDAAENCTGSSGDCPIDGFLAASTQCRGSAGACDVAETCTGSSASCPIDGFLSSSTQCRGSAGACDVAETCTGSSASCPIDLTVSSSVQCRASAGECDVAETCTGSSASCPIDVAAGGGAVCRPSAGDCDVAETCTGSTPSCPIDGFLSSSTQCRGSAGECDVAETCTGSSASCPIDGFASSSVQCRASAGPCDVAETCSGAAASCPVDGFLASTTQCRATAGVCDVAETCTGASGACPADAFRASGFACTSDADVCTDDVCNGAGACVHNDNTAGCDDGAFCTVNDTCSNGDCVGATRNCGDGVGCTTDACNESLNECTHGANNAFCSDGLYCNGVETCNVQSGCVDGSPVVCGDNVGCTVDSCNEASDSCQSVPDDDRCNDADHCTIDTCDAQTGCDHLFSCRDICRPAGFYAKRGGGDGPDIVQEILDATGGLDICGQTLTETSNVDSPYLEGLGLDSALEGLCVRARDVEERSLYQALVATALNCAMSGSDSCDAVVSPFIDVSFSECDAVCENGGSTALVERCIEGLQCYNNGGRMVRGKCALGECNFSGKSCGADYGFCAPITVKLVTYLQSCERFAGNCRDGDFCQPTLDVCPSRTPSTGKPACKEAKTNTCTIDSCE
jgi:hypothetical protein